MHPGQGYIPDVQLTRTQVARRLGKSVATVRRLEGRVLFPRRDWRGIHRFDEWEVEGLQRNPERLKQHARSTWFQRERPSKGARRSENRRASHISSAGEHAALADVLELLLERFAEVDLQALFAAGVDAELIAMMIQCAEEARGAPRS